MLTQFRFNMKLKITILLAFCILLVSCASLLGVQSSKYISEKIEIGMSKNEFQKLFGEPYAKEMITDRYNRPVERLLYQESLYDQEWYTLVTAFTFQDGKLVSQEVVSKQYINRKGNK